MKAWKCTLSVAVVMVVTAACSAEAAPEGCVLRGGLPNVFAKIHRGEAVRIAYLGGSITDAKGWRVMSHEWFEKTFPDAAFTAHNAAHSGTTSDLACFRLQRDCLPFNPDLLFIEFAVNDGVASQERIQRGIEGIIRKARRANPLVDICLVYTLTEGMMKNILEGKTPHTYTAMERIAEHYHLPSIDMGVGVVRLEKAGKLRFKGKTPETDAEKAELGDRLLFSHDGVHPVREGHTIYRDAVARGMKAMESLGEAGPAPLPEPFRADNFEYAQLTPLGDVSLSAGWTKLDPATEPLAERFQEKLPELWCAKAPGESITVRFKGTSILLYDLVGPDCGQIRIIIDGKETKVAPRFDPWCENHRVYYFIGALDLEDTEHTARFEIHPDQPDKVALLAQRGKTMDDPSRYDGTAWYVGDVCVTGKVLPTQ